MRHRFILGVATTLTATSIAIGALTSYMQGTPEYTASPKSVHALSQGAKPHQDGFTAEPNMTTPFLSEDRYVNGEWTGPVTPSFLPHASGEFDPKGN